MNVQHEQVQRIAREIMRYLQDHPGASDGAPGIRDFWLGGAPFPTSASEVDHALNRLVKHGALTRVSLPGSDAIYRLRRFE